MDAIKKKIFEINGKLDELYAETVVEKIRAKYSLNDELAIQRQRDEKPEQFAEYNDYVENCKTEAYVEVYGENKEE